MAAAAYVGLTYMVEATIRDPYDIEPDRFLFRKVIPDATTDRFSVVNAIEEHCNWKATSVVRRGQSGSVHHGDDIVLYNIVSVLEIDGNYFKLSPIAEEN